jgi:uncharacterized membrane protein
LFKAINRLPSSTNTFILHFTSFLPFSSNFLSIVGVSVVSWSLLTVPMNPAIAFQLVWGSYNGQQRPLTSKKDTKYSFRLCSDYNFRNSLHLFSAILFKFFKFCRSVCGVMVIVDRSYEPCNSISACVGFI